MTGDHVLPGAWVALLKGEPLGIGTIRQKHGPLSRRHRPEHVRPDYDAVVHGDPDVPLDAHVILFDRLSHFPTSLPWSGLRDRF